jgi:hypothetical protein
MSGGWVVLLSACGGGVPDPRTVEGAITAIAECVEHEDAAKMFRLIDPRSRHAMASIVVDRRKARALVESSYPPEARPEALASLGDAADVADAAALFAKRCPAACLRGIGEKLGAPTGTRIDHGDTVVTTPRGELRFRGGGEDWYGLVWQTEALADERERANRDLAMITENAETYRRRRTLAQ